MNALPQTDELSRQLRSLSIVRPTEQERSAPQEQAASQKPQRKGLIAGVALGLWGAVALVLWYWLGDPDSIFTKKTSPPKAELTQPIAEEDSALALTSDLSTNPPPAAPAQVAPPLSRLVGSGYLLAGQDSVIGTDVGGRVSEILVAVGDTVRVGQPIARLEDTEAQRALTLAELALAAAQAEVARLSILREQTAVRSARLQSLSSRGLAPATDAEDAAFALRLAEADISAAKLEVKRLGFEKEQTADRLKRLTVTAPFDGIIAEIHAVKGDLIGSAFGGGPVPAIAVLMNPSSLRVDADFAESALSQVSVGQTAEVVLDAWPDARLSARVTAILPRASLQKGTITLRLTLTDVPPNVALLANMAAKITLSR
jgi:RND family efflux transporter MFP subunit